MIPVLKAVQYNIKERIIIMIVNLSMRSQSKKFSY